MGSNHSVLGLTLPWLVLTVVPSALVSAGATRAGYNSDGWPDLLVCGETGGLHLFDNDQGQGFTDVSSFLGAQVNAVDAAMVDVTHDRLSSFLALNGQVPSPEPIRLLTPQPTSMGALTRTVSFHSGTTR